LEGRLSTLITYVNGTLDTNKNRKEILFYDNLERPTRNEIYTWDTLTNNYKEQYDSYTVRYYKTNTGIARYSKPTDICARLSMSNGLLTIESPVSETIDIYSILGSRIYTEQKLSEQSIVSLRSFSQGIYIVKGSSGWTKKICIQ
jgi:hypothetical protein